MPQGKQNGLKDAIQIPHHLGIRYAEDSEAIGRDPPIPDPVIFWRTRNGMRLAIDFDDQPGMMAGKIDVVWADPNLATEVMALLPQSAERDQSLVSGAGMVFRSWRARSMLNLTFPRLDPASFFGGR